MLNISDVDNRTSQVPVAERAHTARRVRHSRVNETHATLEDSQQLRATNQVIEAKGWHHLVTGASACGACSRGGRELDGSCGTLVD